MVSLLLVSVTLPIFSVVKVELVVITVEWRVVGSFVEAVDCLLLNLSKVVETCPKTGEAVDLPGPPWGRSWTRDVTPCLPLFGFSGRFVVTWCCCLALSSRSMNVIPKPEMKELRTAV